MTLRQYLLAHLPAAYADRAIANTEEYYEPTLDRPVGILSEALRQAFIWNASPEGIGFWLAVSQHLDHGLELPPIPQPDLESRIGDLESRIAALESAACDAVPEPPDDECDPEIGEGYRALVAGDRIQDGDEVWLGRTEGWAAYLPRAFGKSFDPNLPPGRRPLPKTPAYPTTPLPDGYDRWEYRGRGWKPGVRAVYTTCCPGPPGTPGLFDGPASEGVPVGYDTLEYWEAVKDTPAHYRLLNEGEVIREGDEYLEDLSIELGELDIWLPVEVSLGRPFDPTMNAPTRRRITSHTDA